MAKLPPKKCVLISESGEQLGVVSVREALAMAEEQDVDLVEISPTAKPPVCKLMDYGKYKYQQAKKRDEAKKNQKQVQIKEIKFRPVQMRRLSNQDAQHQPLPCRW